MQRPISDNSSEEENEQRTKERIKMAKASIVAKLIASPYFLTSMKDPFDQDFKFKMYENHQFLKYLQKSDNMNFITKKVTEKMAEERLKMSYQMHQLKLVSTDRMWKPDKFKCSGYDPDIKPEMPDY